MNPETDLLARLLREGGIAAQGHETDINGYTKWSQAV